MVGMIEPRRLIIAPSQLSQNGATLQGGGQIVLSDSAANIISGTGSVTLNNEDNTIDNRTVFFVNCKRTAS